MLRSEENMNSNSNLKTTNDTAQISSPLQPQCLRVFIQRDYSEGTTVRFQTRFPQELEGRIEQPTFEATINRLNAYFVEAEAPSCSIYCEGCLACLTAYLMYLCKETRYEKCLKKVSKYVSEVNQSIYEPRGLKLTDPSLRGLRVIEITCLDRPPNT